MENSKEGGSFNQPTILDGTNNPAKIIDEDN